MWLYDPIPDLLLPYAEHEIRPCIKEGGQILSVFPLLFFQALKLSLKISWHDQRYQVIFQLTRPECMEETSQRTGTCAMCFDMGKDRLLWPEPHYLSHNCFFPLLPPTLPSFAFIVHIQLREASCIHPTWTEGYFLSPLFHNVHLEGSCWACFSGHQNALNGNNV